MEYSVAHSTDLVILLALVGVVLILLVTMAAHRRRQMLAAQQRMKRSGGSSTLLPPGIRLTPSQQQVLSRLGWLFRNPGQENRLLTDRGLFLRAAGRARAEGLATERELVGLARAAGLPINRISPDAPSTLRLPAGVEVSVADERMKSGAGSIVTNHPDALRLRLKFGYTAFNPGTRLDVVCNSPRGLYRFSSVVTGNNGKTLDVKHTDRIEAVQRRAHQRHGVQLSVDLRRPDGTVRSTRTADLSIGGAATKNPGKMFETGHRLTVIVGTDRSRVTVPAKVVRTSRGGRILHLRFERPSEKARHQLFLTIMAAAQGGRRSA